MKQRTAIQSLLTGLLCLSLILGGGMSVLASDGAGEDPAPVSASNKQTIFDMESGESWEQLTDENVPAWAAGDSVAANAPAGLEIGGKSAILMEKSSGQILFEKNPHEKMPIASVTKVMTLLLIMEAIDSGSLKWEDQVSCSSYAASLGGSQIWLEEGEIMSVSDLVKAIAVVSANDACAMIAEHISGSELGFVAEMNRRAGELGMTNTLFTDTCGLDESAYSTAHDVALMSRALIAHEDITKYTTIWMDTLRDGKSQLVNTNKLVRFYKGATGLKTGTTSKAGHCLSATASRDGMELVSVILGCTTTDERFGGARKMLDYGFANYTVYTPEAVDELPPVKVLKGASPSVDAHMDTPEPLLVRKGQEGKIEQVVEMAGDVQAPVVEGQVVGHMKLVIEGEVLAEYEIVALRAVGKMNFLTAVLRLLQALIT